MNIRRRVAPVLLTMALLPWMGLLQAVPHHHADSTVPQEALSCAASSPSSHENHLHSAGDLVTPHPCVACLAGTNHAAVPTSITLDDVESASPFAAERRHDLRSRNQTQLPLLRGPPAAV